MIGETDVKNYVLQQVAVKTGYPVEMLDLELDLEADLGVDTVKQAELFAAIREHFGVPRREDLRLSDYNTLEKVIAFLMKTTMANLQLTRKFESCTELRCLHHQIWRLKSSISVVYCSSVLITRQI